jgi:hypothetical protein
MDALLDLDALRAQRPAAAWRPQMAEGPRRLRLTDAQPSPSTPKPARIV